MLIMSPVDQIQDTVVPCLSPDDPSTTRLLEIISGVCDDNKTGIELCKSYLVQKQIAAGTYTPNNCPCNLRQTLQDKYGSVPDIKLEIPADGTESAIPAVVVLDIYIVMLMLSNAISNARMHGESSCQVCLGVFTQAARIILTVTNRPGKNHGKCCELQAQYGHNFLIENRSDPEISSVISHAQIGSADSTFLGVSEMKQLADIISSKTSLEFLPEMVRFTYDVMLQTMGESHLPPGMIYICADDDFAARAAYKGMLRMPEMNADMTNSVILGKTRAEADQLKDHVLSVAKHYPEEQIICIFDQNMDHYKEGPVLGTDVIESIRATGFKGLMFIRSANDDFESVNMYRRSGATASLSKSFTLEELTSALRIQYQRACINGFG